LPTAKAFLQVDADIKMQSDPACSTAGCTQYLWPGKKRKIIEYPTDLALDEDIRVARDNIDDQEKIHGTWTPPLDETEIQLDSDPICSSAGCTQYKHKKTPLGYALNYPVPNNGVDRDITDTHASVA